MDEVIPTATDAELKEKEDDGTDTKGIECVSEDVNSGSEGLASPGAYYKEKGKSLTSVEEAATADDLVPAGKTTWVGGSANLVKAMIGAGILALPKAYSDCGIGLGMFTLAFAAVTAYIGFALLARCSEWMNTYPSSYGRLCQMTYPRFAWVVDLTIFFNCFGAAVSYLVIIADNLPTVARAFGVAADSFVAHRVFLMSITFIIIDIPLTCLKNIEKLSYTSGLAIVSIVYVVLLGILFFAAPTGLADLDPCSAVLAGAACKGSIVAATNIQGFLRALPTFVFSYGAHFIVFPIYDTLKVRTLKTMEAKVVAPSTMLATLLYGTFGIFGYLTYGNLVKGNILVSFPNSLPVTVARLLMSFVVAVTYPLYTHGARVAAKNIFNAIFRAMEREEYISNMRVQMAVHWGVTVALLGSTYIIASFVTNLGIVISLSGTIVGVPIAYIMPGIFYIKALHFMRKEENPNHVDTFQDRMRYYVAIFMIAFGVIFLPLALAFIFI